jgi:hypothetical protein
VLKKQIALLALSDGFVLIALSAATCMVLVALIGYAPPMVPAAKGAKS